MSHERNHHRSANHADAALRGARAEPGRETASQALDRPAQPVASGLVMRKRDGNGVAQGADAAVASAAGSSGNALPVPLMRKFESSLGTDLSDVRVHTGAASQTAAQAVGAKAYTTGSAIHFGAGHYDPASTAGEELLAHEVAHTVQQRGGSAARQHKLEVSAPGDHHEVEADRAASAMVAGQPFAVSTGGVSVNRTPNPVITLPEQQINSGDPDVITLPEQVVTDDRKVITLPEVEIDNSDVAPANTEKMNANADAAEKSAADKAKSGGPTVFGSVGQHIVENKAGAQHIIDDITAAMPDLQTGLGTGGVPGSVMGVNQAALAQLSAYVSTQETDSFNNDSFQARAQTLAADFVRLQAQLQTLDKSGQGNGQVSDAMGRGDPGAARGGRIGNEVIDALGQSAATLNKGYKDTLTAGDKDAGHSTNATAHSSDADKAKKDMDDAATEVSQGTRAVLPAQSTAAAAAANVKACAAGVEAGAQQAEVDRLKSDGAAMEENIKTAGGIIKSLAAGGFAIGSANPGAAIGAALDLCTTIAAYAGKHWNDDEAKDAGAKAAVARANEAFQRGKAAAETAKGALQSLKNAAEKAFDSQVKLQKAKTAYRDAMKLMGNSVDKAQGGNAYSINAQVLSEAEVYLTQSQLTLETGRSAIGKQPSASGAPAKPLGPVPNTGGEVTYYVAKDSAVTDDHRAWVAQKGTFLLKGSIQNAENDPAGAVLQKIVDKLQTERDEIEGLAKSLRAVFKK